VKKHDELLALGLQLAPAERVALAHALLDSAGQKWRVSGRADEVAEAVALYDGAFRSKAKVGLGSSEGLWESILAFRATADLESLDVEALLANVRDSSPGREVEL